VRNEVHVTRCAWSTRDTPRPSAERYELALVHCVADSFARGCSILSTLSLLQMKSSLYYLPALCALSLPLLVLGQDEGEAIAELNAEAAATPSQHDDDTTRRRTHSR
jgi:hypothetical protein